MKKILSIGLVLVLTGCNQQITSQSQFGMGDPDNEFNLQSKNFSKYMQCLTENGASDNRLRTVPKENIVAAVECTNKAEQETLIRIYYRHGYDTQKTYQKQSELLKLAKLREQEKISDDIFEIRSNDVISQELASITQQSSYFNHGRIYSNSKNEKVAQTSSHNSSLCDNGLYMLGMNMLATDNPYDQNSQIAKAQINTCTQMRGQWNGENNNMMQSDAEQFSTGTAFYLHRETSNIPTKQTCVYNYMGRKIGLLYPISAMCPMSVDM